MANAIRKTSDDNGIFQYVENIISSDYPSSDWEIDPDVSGVSSVDQNYWKYDGSSVLVEMNQPEQEFVSASLLARRALTTVGGTFAFEKNGKCKNKWLGFGIGKPSNSTPFITTNTLQITGLSFVNSSAGADTDIEVYSNGIRVYTWEIRDQRWAWKSRDVHTLIFQPGDRIGVFLRDRGTDPRNCIVTMHYTCSPSDTGEGGGNTL